MHPQYDHSLPRIPVACSLLSYQPCASLPASSTDRYPMPSSGKQRVVPIFLRSFFYLVRSKNVSLWRSCPSLNAFNIALWSSRWSAAATATEHFSVWSTCSATSTTAVLNFALWISASWRFFSLRCAQARWTLWLDCSTASATAELSIRVDV